MLTSLYRGVIRLHPPAFREKFGDEMLSIFERAQGATSTITLLLDALVSLARQWGLRSEFWYSLDPAPVQPVHDDVPTFSSLNPFRPRSAAVIEGLLLSVTLFCLTCFAIRYSWIHVLHVRIPEVQFERPTWRPPTRSTFENESLARTAAPVQQQNPAPVLSPNLPSAANASTLASPRPPAKTPSRKRVTSISRDAALAESNDSPNSSGERFASTVEAPLPPETLEGTYVVESPRKLTIVVAREGDDLTMRMADQLTFGLIPASQTKFLVRGVARCWVDFIPNRDSEADPAIRQLRLSCDGEQLIARRQ